MITFFVVSLVPPFSTHCHLFRVFPSGLISPDGSRNQKTWPSIVNNICCIKASESLNKSIARWDDRLDSLESIGPHDHVMRLSLVEYSTPSPCTKIAGLITLLSRDRGGANLGSLECSTFFQKDAASWKQKKLSKGFRVMFCKLAEHQVWQEDWGLLDNLPAVGVQHINCDFDWVTDANVLAKICHQISVTVPFALAEVATLC